MMRLNKYIANSGVCSRRKADEYILDGRVKINSNIVYELGTNVDENKDIVEVNGHVVRLVQKKVYIMLNKPEGYVTTVSDQFDRPSVTQLIKEDMRVFPVGRLDMYTEGLLLLTNDGEFANKLMHPRNKIEKTYYVRTYDKITVDFVDKLTKGVDIGDYITKPAKVKKVSDNEFEITISEGKNRQIRKMCESQMVKVKYLKRIRVGNLTLSGLKVGEYRFLTKSQVDNI
ncbi:MAG: rRNA pseudouridine synthase [Clostridia bacterium]|nr:rRNA pseudouridine synthase [Clostridia bacterium]